MRARIMGWAIAGTLSWLPTPAHPAVAQGSDPTGSPGPIETRAQLFELEREHGELSSRIDQADRLLQQVDAGAMLIPTGMGMQAVERDRIVEWATDQLAREGMGIGGTVGQQEVLRRVQQWAATGTRLAAALRQARSDDFTRQQAVLDEHARVAERHNAFNARQIAIGCGFPHSWHMVGRGSLDLAVDASGNVSGSGGMTGRATLAGNQLTIQWFARTAEGEMAGRYIVALDQTCNGAGEAILDVVPAGAGEVGIRGMPVTFTSLGAGPS